MDSPTSDEDAMAQMMGFSSFGSQNPPQKKRKYNPHADAVVDSANQFPNGASATGSNSTPLGAVPSRRDPNNIIQDNKAAAANTDEIDLGDDDENEDAASSAAENTAAATHAEASSSLTQVRPEGLPERPAQGAGFVGSASGQQRQHRGQGNHGGPQHIWYNDYYDPSSNENPWKRLEESMGLGSLGT